MADVPTARPAARPVTGADAEAVPSSSADMDVFSSLTEIKPGTIPLLVRMPNNNFEQIEVPLTSTVEDLAATLGKGVPGAAADDLRLSFGNSDLRPGATLLESNVIDAYEHAGSLLNIIDAGELDPVAKAAALDSACAVVESISNGIKDMETLCARAMEGAPAFPIEAAPPSPQTAGIVAAGAAEAERDTPKEIDEGEFKMLNSMLSRPAKDPTEPDAAPAASPSQLARSLSRRLPELFPPSATAAELEPEPEYPVDVHHPDAAPSAPGPPSQSLLQPSLSSIRDARRRARRAQADAPSTAEAEKSAANAVTIGGSTNGVVRPPPPAHVAAKPSASQRPPVPGSGRELSAIMAAKAKSTWLEDVFKTWEVKSVRQSGVLEKSKEGQEISDYFNELDAEAQREVETLHIEAQKAEDDALQKTAPQDAVDSEEDDHRADKPNGHLQGAVNQGQVHSRANSGTTPSVNQPASNSNSHGAADMCESMANVGLSDPTPVAKGAASQMIKAQNAATAAIMNKARSIKPERRLQNAQMPQTPPSGQSMPASRATTPSTTSSQPTESMHSGTTGMASGSKPPPKLRQATKIAPAPNVAAAISPGVPGVVPNGAFPNQVYPSGIAPAGVWSPPPTAPAPKKRGRKRKNPELTEEERALVRKEQNRESAKLSRVRRKVIAAEYEGRLNALVGENTLLRKQVEALNNRLVYLQSLLTISVRQEPGTDGRR